ncbi:protein phosphatase 2C domain-containing protein [soil metagenome]
MTVQHNTTEHSLPSSPARGEAPHLHMSSYGISDRGLKRESNEDCFVIAEFARGLNVHHTNLPQPRSQVSSHRGHIFLVADGVGGHRAGEVASAMTVMSIEAFLLDAFRRLTSLPDSEEQSVLNDLKTALFQADARLFQEIKQHPEWQGMGTTLTMTMAVNRRLFVAHAGDSRCYLYSGGTLQQITHDHTLTAEMHRAGILTANETASHPWRHIVSNLLGGSEPGVRVELHSLKLHDDDVVLLCTDGLTEMVTEDRIAEILKQEIKPKAVCEALVAEANRLGGRDNFTVIAARFLESD